MRPEATALATAIARGLTLFALVDCHEDDWLSKCQLSFSRPSPYGCSGAVCEIHSNPNGGPSEGERVGQVIAQHDRLAKQTRASIVLNGPFWENRTLTVSR